MTSRTNPIRRLSDTTVSNQCTLVCDLRSFDSPDSEAWIVLTGSEDAIGSQIAGMLEAASIQRLDDFGGVCETFLCRGEEYLDAPPRTAPGAAVLSFTPRNRIAAEAAAMARAARAAGYSLMILTLQKHGKFGKVWVLRAALRHCRGRPLTYYEDTNTVIDDLKASPEGARIRAIHLVAPEFAHLVSRLADGVISQAQYRQEVLLRL